MSKASEPKILKTPLQRTVGELACLVDGIRSDCAKTTAALLATHEPDAEAISDLARLDEALAKANESVANVCSVLLVRQQLRQLRAGASRIRKSR